MFVLHGRVDECQQRGRKLGLKVVHRKQQCLSNSVEEKCFQVHVTTSLLHPLT